MYFGRASKFPVPAQITVACLLFGLVRLYIASVVKASPDGRKKKRRKSFKNIFNVVDSPGRLVTQVDYKWRKCPLCTFVLLVGNFLFGLFYYSSMTLIYQ